MNPLMNPTMFQPYSQAPALPMGWAEYRMPSGQPYWYNSITLQSSWVYPLAHPPAAPKKNKQIKKKIPGTNWLFVLTHDGYEFYYDRDTKTSLWEMPESLKQPMEDLKHLEKTQKEEAERLEQENEDSESKKRALEEAEAEQKAKRVHLEQEIVDATDNVDDQEQELDNTEMTEEDIMWQLQQQAEDEVGDMELLQQQAEEELLAQQEEAPPAKPTMSEEEKLNQFQQLLKETITSPFAIYATEYPKLMTDPRFLLVPGNKQKTLFNKFCQDLGEKQKQEKKSVKKPEDQFRELLEAKVTTKMYWDDFRRKFKDDARFKILPTKEKDVLFKYHIKHNLNKKPLSAIDAYKQLLRESKLEKGMRWRDARLILEKDDRYHAIAKEKREDLFRDYLEE